jgi:hypothetical protein
MSQDIKQIIREEYLKCAADPAHFMKKYCFIQHPQRGRIIFNLYPFQGKVLNLWKDNPYSIVLKSRQLGISTLAAGYSLWLMLFHKDKNVLCLATKQETAKNMVTKVRFMYENLPSWLKIPTFENNKLSLKLNNGSQVKAVSAAGDAGRSEAVSLLIVDEAAFIDNIAEIWASAQQTLATGGGAIVLSTPYGTGNWFHQTWVKAESDTDDMGGKKFLPIKLPWYVHPERDESWRKLQDELLGDPRLAAQECDCNFATSGDVVFYPEYIEFYEQTYMKEPIERRGVDKNLWIWETADYSRSYMIVADVARGDGKDFSAFHIIDIENNAQVGEYKGQLSTSEFGHLLVGIASEYNDALLVVENSNMGWATIQTIQERGYRNLYFSPKSDKSEASTYFDKYADNSNLTPGFTNSLKTRPMVINKLREYINEKSITCQSKRLIEEMKVFIWKNGRAEAQSGYNDDLVMSMGIAMYVRDTALKFNQHGAELSKSILNNYIKTSFNAGGYTGNSMRSSAESWNMDISGQQEDIKWLL